MYLEELSDRIEESDVQCQTDAFLDRPATPLFIPAKTGKDVATQILEGEVWHTLAYLGHGLLLTWSLSTDITVIFNMASNISVIFTIVVFEKVTEHT